ncbi:MAG TPA: Fur family transcriptional regulator [Acidimicrobiales bacterium]|nr:Fur family transcriptional regulator [Acidimicrobiales bacterium]
MTVASGPRPERVEALLDRIRRRGGRVTSARRALLVALLGADNHHLTAQDLADAVQRAVPDVHLSTIYRSLDSLEEMGIVDHAHLGHGRAVYHLVDEPHQHLVCERCEAVVEVPDDVFAELAATVHRAYGFVIRAHHFAVVGRCAACAGAPELSDQEPAP